VRLTETRANPWESTGLPRPPSALSCNSACVSTILRSPRSNTPVVPPYQPHARINATHLAATPGPAYLLRMSYFWNSDLHRSSVIVSILLRIYELRKLPEYDGQQRQLLNGNNLRNVKDVRSFLGFAKFY
jgi:hypothetical protein